MSINSLSCLDIKSPKQTQRRSPLPYVPDVAASVNLAKGVVAVAEVLGSTPVEVLATQNFTTRGPRVFAPANYDYSPRQ